MTLVLPRGEDAARDLGVLNIANAGPQVLAPLFTALIIGHLGGYRVLFIIGGCCGIAGAIAVLPVRSVRQASSAARLRPSIGWRDHGRAHPDVVRPLHVAMAGLAAGRAARGQGAA